MSITRLHNVVGQVIFASVKFYCRHSPFRKGKARLFVTLCKITKYRPPRTLVKSADGRFLNVDFGWGGMEELYFLGEYERGVTAALSAVIRPGDLCIDVGANIGWFSTLMASLACQNSGTTDFPGHVLAIEPSSQTRIDLERNLALLPVGMSVTVAQIALGSRAGKATLCTFPGLPNGHASLSDQGFVGALTESVEVVTLNQLLRTFKPLQDREVDVVKVDIEGYELFFLQGATELFRQKQPPILFMEMALETSKHFGYSPQALIEFIQTQTPYEFFALDPTNTSMQKVDRFPEGHIGANVVGIPVDTRQSQFRRLVTEVPITGGTLN
jgi:FkbM family methyltransferase